MIGGVALTATRLTIALRRIVIYSLIDRRSRLQRLTWRVL